MDQQILAGIKPANETAAALAASLAAIDAAIAAAHARVPDLRERRTALLLAGNTAEIPQAQQAIDDMQIDLDQLAALRQAIADRLATAQLAEGIAGLKARAIRIGVDGAALADDVLREYPRLAAALADLMRRIRDHDAARAELSIEVMRALPDRDQREVHAAIGASVRALVLGGSATNHHFQAPWLPASVRLPGFSMFEPPYWTS